jgi:hypothetical protein
MLNVASISTLGLYRHHETVNDSLMAKLDEQRRSAWSKLQMKALPPAPEEVLANRTNPSPLAQKAGMFQ